MSRLLWSVLVLLVFASVSCRAAKFRDRGPKRKTVPYTGRTATACSGNGIPYPDVGECVCNQCYEGMDCHVFQENCTVSMNYGQPNLLQEYWFTQRPNVSMIPIPVYYRSPYQAGYFGEGYVFPPGPLSPDSFSKLSRDLNKAIRAVHAMVGNVVTDEHYIIIGDGCRELISAAMYAYSTEMQTTPMHWFHRTPYYDGYIAACQGNQGYCVWDTSYNQTNTSIIVEMSTIPDNPDGQTHPLHYPAATKRLFDLAFYWPHYTTIDKKLDEELMVFTLTKMSGHASARFGWALTKNRKLAMGMWMYMFLDIVEPSVYSQQMALTIFEDIIATKGEMFDWAKNVLVDRWTQLQTVFQGNKHFTIKSTPGTAFAWIHCNFIKTSKQCVGLFAQYLIQAEDGVQYGMNESDSFIRLSLVEDSSTWTIAIGYLQNLISHHSSPTSTDL